MRYEWDPVKDAENRRKHGLGLEDGIEALEAPNFLSWTDDRYEYGEVRSTTVGLGKRGILLVISTLRSENETRLISVRKASKYEHNCYCPGRP
jgi:uncharacterized DUF497 family protein